MIVLGWPEDTEEPNLYSNFKLSNFKSSIAQKVAFVKIFFPYLLSVSNISILLLNINQSHELLKNSFSDNIWSLFSAALFLPGVLNNYISTILSYFTGGCFHTGLEL